MKISYNKPKLTLLKPIKIMKKQLMPLKPVLLKELLNTADGLKKIMLIKSLLPL